MPQCRVLLTRLLFCVRRVVATRRRFPTPMLRIGFALALLLRFGWSVVLRSTTELGAEQEPLIDASSPLVQTLQGFASSSKQSIVLQVDWTIVAMLFSSILSGINYPGEMAVVRLRCDTRRYFNWRDQYLGAMEVRAARRDLDAADATLWLRAKLPVWLERQRERLRSGVKRSVSKLSHSAQSMSSSVTKMSQSSSLAQTVRGRRAGGAMRATATRGRAPHGPNGTSMAQVAEEQVTAMSDRI